MHWLGKVGIGVAALIAVLVAVFWQDIREVRALLDYASSFEAEQIDTNFRTFYQRYPSVKIAREGDIYQLPEAPRNDALPKQYDYEGEMRDTQAFLKATQTTGLAIMLGDELIYEYYDRGNSQQSRAILMSVSKSMTSFLIGVVFEKGQINSLDDLVTAYAPDLKGSAYDGVTIKQVLEMSSGVRWSEDLSRLDSDLAQSIVAMQLGSLDEFTKKVSRENTPGTYNRYASIDTHVLGMVLRGATGLPYEQILQQELWSKLGAEDDAYILVDTVQQPLAFGGVNARLRDMIRFGKLYLDKGRNHKGEQLVSENWVNTSTQPDSPRLLPSVDNPQSDSGFGFKYQWWVPFYPDGNDFAAIGIYGQFIYVNPARKVVIVKTSGYVNYTEDGGIKNHETLMMFQSIAKHLSPD